MSYAKSAVVSSFGTVGATREMLGAASSFLAIAYGSLAGLTFLAGGARMLADGHVGIGSACLAGSALFVLGVRAIATRPNQARV